jgi:hypothetical protein
VLCATDTQFVCFTSTKVQILTAEELRGRQADERQPQFTCYTSTKEQILTQELLLLPQHPQVEAPLLSSTTAVYLLYQFKETNTDAGAAATATASRSATSQFHSISSGVSICSFVPVKQVLLYQKFAAALDCVCVCVCVCASGTQFTCFTGTKVQILTAEELRGRQADERQPQFTCFTCTKVQILTGEELRGSMPTSDSLSLLALLVQKCKY